MLRHPACQSSEGEQYKARPPLQSLPPLARPDKQSRPSEDASRISRLRIGPPRFQRWATVEPVVRIKESQRTVAHRRSLSLLAASGFASRVVDTQPRRSLYDISTRSPGPLRSVRWSRPSRSPRRDESRFIVILSIVKKKKKKSGLHARSPLEGIPFGSLPFRNVFAATASVLFEMSRRKEPHCGEERPGLFFRAPRWITMVRNKETIGLCYKRATEDIRAVLCLSRTQCH